MKLQERLDQIKEGAKTRVPEAARAVMAQAVADLVASGLAEKAVRTGDRMPAFSLPAVSGRREGAAGEIREGHDHVHERQPDKRQEQSVGQRP